MKTTAQEKRRKAIVSKIAAEICDGWTKNEVETAEIIKRYFPATPPSQDARALASVPIEESDDFRVPDSLPPDVGAVVAQCLRAFPHAYDMGGHDENVCQQAADLLTRQSAEIARLKSLPIAASFSASLAEANKDVGRLDWLIKQGPPGAADGIGLNDETWEVACSLTNDELNTDSVAVRTAIDAAMRSTETKP